MGAVSSDTTLAWHCGNNSALLDPGRRYKKQYKIYFGMSQCINADCILGQARRCVKMP